jgi:hypothetical protein
MQVCQGRLFTWETWEGGGTGAVAGIRHRRTASEVTIATVPMKWIVDNTAALDATAV